MSNNSWNNKELEILSLYYSNYSNEFVQEKLKEQGYIRTKWAIAITAGKHNLSKNGRRKSSKNITYEEREILIDNNKNYCNVCHKVKDLSRFSEDKHSAFGYRNDCHDCRQVKNINRKFCNSPNIECYFCTQPFYLSSSTIKNQKHHFCSQECQNNWRSNNFKKNNINKKGYSTIQEATVIRLLNEGYTYTEIEEITSIRRYQILVIRKNNNVEYIGRNKYKSELHRKLKKLLLEMFPYNYIVDEYYIQETKQFFDLYDKTTSIAYEANGIQHYQQESTWSRSDEAWELQQERDQRKITYCKDNNIPLVIIRYDDEVTQELIIEKLKEQGIIYEDVKDASSFLLSEESG